MLLIVGECGELVLVGLSGLHVGGGDTAVVASVIDTE